MISRSTGNFQITNAIGPGKADLLEAIANSGSIAEAARSMDMSYRKAWALVRALNEAFALPLVETRKGGLAGGSATLTKAGQQTLNLYRQMEKRAARAIAREARQFRKLLTQ